MRFLRRGLKPAEQKQFDTVVDAVIADFDTKYSANSGQAGDAIWRRVKTSAELGHAWANHVIDVVMPMALGQHAKGVAKEQRGTVKIAYSGEVVDLPQRFGVRAIKSNGVKAGDPQLPLWVELSWAQFERLLESLRSQRNRLGLEVEALEEVFRLRERFPESKTPAEACRMAGIDPRSFDLTSAQ